VLEEVATYTADLAYKVANADGSTTIERVATGETWSVPAAGRPVYLSPGNARLAWQVSNVDGPAERRIVTVWVANLDGSEARSVATLPRGSVAGWLSDDVLLVRSRESLQATVDVLERLTLDGERREVLRAEGMRGTILSPDGSYLAYYVSGNEDPAANGLFTVPTDGGPPRAAPDGLFGGYRWRDADTLLVIPLELGAPSHRFVQYDVRGGEVVTMTDPAITPFRVANGEWAVSPDGTRVVFLSEADRNLWVMALPVAD
jgi:hypothetical protein